LSKKAAYGMLLMLFLIFALLLTSAHVGAIQSTNARATLQETDFAKFNNLSYYGLDNLFSSLNVSGTVILCDDYDLNESADFNNYSNTAVALGNWSKIVKSLEVNGTVILYENPDFTGREATFTSNTLQYDNIGTEWNNNANLTMSNDSWDPRMWYWGVDFLETYHRDEHNYVNWSSDGLVESSIQDEPGDLWKAANFDQGYERYESEIYNLSDYPSGLFVSWNHQAMSVVVEGSVTLYDGIGYTGSNITLVNDTSDLAKWNNRASSLKLGNSSRVTLYSSTNYRGASISFVNPSYQPADLKVTDMTTITLEGVVQDRNTTTPGVGLAGWTGAKFDVFAVENRSSHSSKTLMLEMYFLRTGSNLAWPAWCFVPGCFGDERQCFRGPPFQSGYNYLVALDAFPGIANRTIYPGDREKWTIDVKAFIEGACNHFSDLDISQLHIVKMCFTLEAAHGLLSANSVSCSLDRLRLAYTMPSSAVASFYCFKTKPQVNETAKFDATSSFVPGGNYSSYAWDFGDGNITITNQTIISHTFSSPGNYTVTLNATTDYGLWNITSRQILVTFKTDLNKDGKVDLLDMIIVAAAFGSKPGDPRWNAMADVDQNGTVNILDLILVAKDFGKVAW
jgi:hypothetical protein